MRLSRTESKQLASTTVALGADVATVHDLTRVIGCGVDGAVFKPGNKSDRPRVLLSGPSGPAREQAGPVPGPMIGIGTVRPDATVVVHGRPGEDGRM